MLEEIMQLVDMFLEDVAENPKRLPRAREVARKYIERTLGGETYRCPECAHEYTGA
jgi:hypothetical protein